MIRLLVSNQQNSPAALSTGNSESDHHKRRLSSGEMIGLCLIYVISGSGCGAFIYSFAFILLLFIAESSCVPPLQPVENFGQFGVIPLGLGLLGAAQGLLCGIIPLVGARLWILGFTVIQLVGLISTGALMNAANTLFVAYIGCCFVYVCLILLIDLLLNLTLRHP